MSDTSSTWGIIPAAGIGSRIQPLAFSKELLPVGSKITEGQERPRAVSEYLVERLILGGATKLCFVISPQKTDILSYYGARLWGVDIAYVVQPTPAGLCDAVFRCSSIVNEHENVIVGLPDTIWSPEGALCSLPEHALSFLLFPVQHPEFFDAVIVDEMSRVREIQVKHSEPESRWIWGAFKMPGDIFHALRRLWQCRNCCDEYFGTLINAWIAEGGIAYGIPAGIEYVDVGTLHGYREAMQLLASGAKIPAQPERSGHERTSSRA
jgi:dTDP-glucose pyrophosphorylase